MALGQSVSDLGATALSVVRTRLELFSLEAAEQRSRMVRLLVMAFGALVCLLLAVFVFTLLVALYFWPTEHRFLALAMLALVYAVFGGALFWAVRRALVNDPPPFSATLDELRRDAALLDRARAPAGASRPEHNAASETRSA
ncbi:MAG: phage holin family protein [Pusillimonas sp.]